MNKSSIVHLTITSLLLVIMLGASTTADTAGGAYGPAPSDARLKRDIQTMPVGLDQIMELEPVTFYWKNEKKDRRKHFGLVAQQVQTVLPELVQESLEDDGLNEKRWLLLNYQELIPILVSAIQDLKVENEHLSTRLDSLSGQVNGGR